MLLAWPLLLPGCGRGDDSGGRRPSAFRTLMSGGASAVPGVWDRKACEQACDDADMSEPIRRPENADYVKCYKACE